MKILLVEDDRVAQQLLKGSLEWNGHKVVTANDGTQAWKIFNSDTIRLIISDWVMPASDGLEFCKKVRNKRADQYAYFIMLTVKKGLRYYHEAMAAGVDDFLTKPLETSELLICLHVAERILAYTTHIQQLESILPVCMYCKKIRDDQNRWYPIENYIQRRTGTKFSGAACPECHEKYVKPQIFAAKRGTKLAGD